MFGKRFAVLDRDNWTGFTESIDQLGIGTQLHGLLQASWCRAFPAEAAKAAANKAAEAGAVVPVDRDDGDAEPLPPPPVDDAPDGAHPDREAAVVPARPNVADGDEAKGGDDRAAQNIVDGQPVGEDEGGRPKTSVWRETGAQKIHGTATWVLSGRMKEDLVIARTTHTHPPRP